MDRESVIFKMFGKFCPQGTILFNAGDPGEEMYYVQSGAIRVRGGEMGEKERSLGPGELLGEDGFPERSPRRTMAEAVEDTRLIVIDSTNIESVVRTAPDVAANIMGVLMQALDSAWQELQDWQFGYYLRKLEVWLRRRSQGDTWTITEASLETETDEENIRRIFAKLVDAGVLMNEGGLYRLVDLAPVEQLVKETG